MQSPLFFLEALVIAIALFAALNHAILAFSRYDQRLHLMFMVLALAACAFEVGNYLSYSAETVEEMVSIHKWRLSASSVFFVTLPWFAVRFSGLRARWPAIVLSTAAAAGLLFSWALPYGLYFSGEPQLAQRQLPWGELIIWAEASGVGIKLENLLFLLSMGFAIYCSAAQFHRSDKVPALALMSGSTLGLVFLLLNFLIVSGMFEFVYVGGWGFVALVVTMSVYVSYQLRRFHRQELMHELQLRSIVDHADALVYLKDRQGAYRLVNRRFEEVTGVRQEKLAGKSLSELFPPQFADQMLENDALVYQEGVTLEFDQTMEHEDGKHVYRTIKFPIQDSTGGIIGLCGIATDVTEQKRLLREVSRQSEELCAVHKELETFSYSVAHDLRSPLNAIHGFSQLLMMRFRNRLDEESQKFLQMILESSGQMDKMLNALVELARISQVNPNKTTVNLTAIARDIAAYLQKKDAHREVEISIQEGLEVEGQSELLAIMLNNLLRNAWKYTAQVSDARIEVGTLKEDDQTVHYVKDNGAGFDMAQQDRLFLPFQRLHGEDEFGGSGFGLSIVKRIVEYHGGMIWAESQPGSGATFYFQL